MLGLAEEDPRGVRTVFLPRWPDNPYQDLLASGLARHGVRVDSLARAALFVAAVLRGGVPDLVHLHAPDHFVVYAGTRAAARVRLAGLIAQLRILRALGARLVWTAHDLVNHEGRHLSLDRACRRLTGALADAVIVHCAEARREVNTRFGVPLDKLFVIPHGHYLDAYAPTTLDRLAARRALGVAADVTLFLLLGNLRRHKDVGALIDAFASLGRDDVRLLVAGQPFTPDVGDDLAARATQVSGVDVRPGFVPADEVSVYMQAADAVVCPLVSGLTSGSVALAMSFGRACVAPRLGCIPETLAPGGAFLYEPECPGALAGALGAAADARSSLEAMGRRNREAIEARAWPAIAAATLEVYRNCLTRVRGRRSDTAPRTR